MKKILSGLFILAIVFSCGGSADSTVKDFINANNTFADAITKAGSADDVVTAINNYTKAAQAFFEKAENAEALATVSEEVMAQMSESQTNVTNAFMEITEYMSDQKVMDAFKNMQETLGGY